MISAALKNANIHQRQIFSVDAVKRYKPAREVYEALLKDVGKEEKPEECWLVSGSVQFALFLLKGRAAFTRGRYTGILLMYAERVGVD